MYISVSIHVNKKTEPEITIHEGNKDTGEFIVMSIGEASIFIEDREKLLEIASKMEQAAQKWGNEERNGS